MKKIRWAVCGLGKISKQFLIAVKEAGDCEVVACASSSKERAKAYAKKHNIANFGSYEEIASRTDIDAVYICNNMSDHFRCMKLFLNSKIPVLCEKAFTQNIHEASEVIELARKNDTLLMEAMWTKFLPSTQKVIEITNSKMLGEITNITAQLTFNMRIGNNKRIFTKSLGGGSVLDLGVYVAAYPYFLLGKPLSIETKGKVKNNIDLYQESKLLYANNVTANIKSSIVARFNKMKMQIDFTNGYIKVPLFIRSKKVLVNFNGKVNKYKYSFSSGYKYQIIHFNNLLRAQKKESDVQTFKNTLEVMQVLSDINSSLNIEFDTKI